MKIQYYTVDTRTGTIHSRHTSEKAALARLTQNGNRNLKVLDPSDRQLSHACGVVKFYRGDTLPLWSKFPE